MEPTCYETYCKPRAKTTLTTRSSLTTLHWSSLTLKTNLTQNNTDHVLSTVDVTIQRPGHVMHVDGNIWVSVDLTLVNVSTQRQTGTDLTCDIDDQVEFDDFALVESHTQNDLTQNDTDHVLSTVDVTILRPGHMMPVDGNIQVSVDLTLVDVSTQTTGIGLTHALDYLTQSNTGCGLLSVDGDIQVTGNNGVQIPHSIPKGITKITELTLKLFDNKYNLYAKKINHPEEGLFIRVILMKNNTIFFNNTYKIIATIASADQVCNQYLVHADKGDSFIYALGDSHNGV